MRRLHACRIAANQVQHAQHLIHGCKREGVAKRTSTCDARYQALPGNCYRRLHCCIALQATVLTHTMERCNMARLCLSRHQ
jgi:hypothetical protein